jgi:hypothetical protein
LRERQRLCDIGAERGGGGKRCERVHHHVVARRTYAEHVFFAGNFDLKIAAFEITFNVKYIFVAESADRDIANGFAQFGEQG